MVADSLSVRVAVANARWEVDHSSRAHQPRNHDFRAQEMLTDYQKSSDAGLLCEVYSLGVVTFPWKVFEIEGGYEVCIAGFGAKAKRVVLRIGRDFSRQVYFDRFSSLSD